MAVGAFLVELAFLSDSEFAVGAVLVQFALLIPNKLLELSSLSGACLSDSEVTVRALLVELAFLIPEGLWFLNINGSFELSWLSLPF